MGGRLRVNRKKRLRPLIKNADPDTKWSHIHEWYHNDKVGTTEIGDRLGCSRGAVEYALNNSRPSERDAKVPPPLSSEMNRDIAKRRKMVHDLAEVTEGNGVHLRCKFPTAGMIAEEMQRRLGAVEMWSPATVHRDLMHGGTFKCMTRPQTSKARGAYDPVTRLRCIDNILAALELESIIFSDEKWFDTNDHGRRKQYVRVNGGVLYPRQHTQHCTTAHFWGAIGKGFRLLIELPPGMGLGACSADFIRVVLAEYVAEIKRTRSETTYILQQDGNSIHTSKESLRFLGDSGLLFFSKGEWPSYSPDLSPIENLWELLQRKIDAYPKKNLATDAEKKDELIRNVWKAWHSTTQDGIDKYVLSAAERFQECVETGGEWTNH